ncbi:MAG: MCE family protein [Mycobacteriaceae bacterium]|nr:MCE family protein [Mycobacteriaceae bacterium]
MTRSSWLRRVIVIATCVAITVTGCAFEGLNSLPLPGPGHLLGPSGNTYHVEIANVGTLESNSPVMINDVIVGSVGNMSVRNWHAYVDVTVKPDVVVPANAVASVGQTSLLGSMHLQLNPPPGEPARGRLAPGSTIALNKSSTYPSTEQTLSSLSLVVNGGGLGQIGDIIHNFSTALSGHEQQVRDLLIRLNDFVGVLDDQRDSIVASIQSLNRLANTFAGQRDVITEALNKVPPALDVLIKERPNITTALVRLGTFSDTTTQLVNDSEAYLVRNLQNLEPIVRALVDVGPDLAAALAYVPHFPYSQDLIDRAVRGDYANLFAVLDISRERLKRTLLLGTRFGQPGAELPAAPGEPYFLRDMYDPVNVATAGLRPSLPDTPPGVPRAAVTQASAPQAPPAGTPGAAPAPLAPLANGAPPAPQAPPPAAETPFPPSQQDVGG